jgi:hypothetical protein
MKLSIISSFAILLVVSYLVTPKRLHIFERLFVWLLFQFIYFLYLGTVTTNLKNLVMPESNSLYVSYIIFNAIIIPLVILWYLEFLHRLQSLFAKIVITIFWVGVMVSFEYIASSLHVFYRQPVWELWWSVIIWSVFLLIAYISDLIVKKMMKDELSVI